MKQDHILSIDQSTQGTKALLLDGGGGLVLRRDVPHRQLINEKGWVGHDAREIAANIFRAARRVVEESGVEPGRIAGVAVTNQRESVAVWERESGQPVCESIVWQCSRASELCARLREAGHYPEIFRRTGLVPSPFFSAGKVAWVLENVPGAREKARRGQLCLGTMDTWTLWQLTGGAAHKTDCSNASRTQLFNIHTMQWDEELCRIFGIPESMLPQVCDSDGEYGCTDLGGLLPAPVPIHAAIGDSHAALFAHGCTHVGDCMAGHGTGTCVMMNVGQQPVLSQNGVNTTVAWRMNGQTSYALEGVVNYAGAVTTWLESLGLVDAPAQTGELSLQADPGDTTYLVPAFTGIGAPYWDDGARASFTGMSRLTGRAELVRAGMDSIAYQVADIVRAFERSSGIPAREVRMAGGPTKNEYLMQFQSDIMALPAAVGEHEELVGIGAGQIAGLSMGLYDPARLEEGRRLRYYYPRMSEEVRREKLAGWERAVASVLGGRSGRRENK